MRCLIMLAAKLESSAGMLSSIETGSTPTAGSTVPVRNLYTGEVMYYRNIPGTRRTLTGAVIVWK